MDRRDILKMAVGMTPLVVAGNQFKRIEPEEIKALPAGQILYLVNPQAVDIVRLCEEACVPGQIVEVKCRPGMGISDEFQALRITWDESQSTFQPENRAIELAKP